MLYQDRIWVGTGQNPVFLLPEMVDRHGLIVGATGTGKTVTAKVLAEGFSAMGVPVVMSDVKGTLSGMVRPGEFSPKIGQRLADCGVPSFCFRGFPTVFWDAYGERGHPIRTLIQCMSPQLLGRILGLNDTQSAVLSICYRVANDEGMLILDLKDLQAMLIYVGEKSKEYIPRYGFFSTASIGVALRAITALEAQGVERIFGEPAINIADWFMVDEDGFGNINIIACDKLIKYPVFYSTYLFWMLCEIYDLLPEAKGVDKPRLVFFFDEAHLLFRNCTPMMSRLIERIIRLIRTKAVAVYFVTNEPADIPLSILGQLGNRIVHALYAYTPQQQRFLNSLAQTFRPSTAFDCRDAIGSLRDGHALVSFLDKNGTPTIVEQATILPPQSYMSPITDELRQSVIETSPFAGVYDKRINREEAYKILKAESTDNSQNRR